MKYSKRKNIKTRKNSIKKSRKNRSRKLYGGVKTSSVFLFPLALSSSFVIPNNKPFLSSRISTQIQEQPSTFVLPAEAGSGGGFIPPGEYSSITSFQDDPPRPKDENEHKEITETELLKKLGMKETNFERLIKAEREGAKNEQRIKKIQEGLDKIKEDYPELFS